MKKLVLLTLCCIAIALQTSYAQRLGENLRLGGQLSPGVTWLSSPDKAVNSNGVRIGLKLGMTADYYFSENYALSTGIGFAFANGGKLKYDNAGRFWQDSDLSKEDYHNVSSGGIFNYNIQYIEIPIGLKMRTSEFGYIRYYGEIPVFTLGYATQARGAISSAAVTTDGEDIRKSIRRLNLSWGLGGGIEYSLTTNTSLVAGVYYQQGFLDVTDNDNTYSDGSKDNSKSTLGVVTLRIGLLF